MQIRLTVIGPRHGHQTAPAACDVLVTAPAGTPLSAVASGLAATVGGPETPAAGAAGSPRGGTVVLYAGAERLDAQRRILGEPPLVDGAVLGLHAPVPDDAYDAYAAQPGPPAQLQVVAGPDAGGVHLLHPGRIRVGRSAGADVPLDDPDVSRLHCEVLVGEDGRVGVADLGSTNGTAVDGVPVGADPVLLPPGALLRVGESTLRLCAAAARALPLTPDLEGHLILPGRAPAAGGNDGPGDSAAGGAGAAAPGAGSGGAAPGGPGAAGPAPGGPGAVAVPSVAAGHLRVPAAVEPEGRPLPHPPLAGESPGRAAAPGPVPGHLPGAPGPAHHPAHGLAHDPAHGLAHDPVQDPARDPARGGAKPEGGRRRGIGAWARKWVGRETAAEEEPVAGGTPAAHLPGPDNPAALLLAALGPTGRLWPGVHDHGGAPGPAGPAGPAPAAGHAAGPAQGPHPAGPAQGPRPGGPEQGAPGASGLSSVTLGVGCRVSLRATASLALGGPRPRVVGLARAVLAQLAAAHAPGELEIVLLACDRARTPQERLGDWGWLGWLPHTRPAHGQDCRLLLAYDREQAAARTAELSRRLDDGPLGPGWAAADAGAVRRAAAGYRGPATVVLLDGDPGPGPLRDLTGRLASHGPAAGIHLVVLAETAAASPASPVTDTFEAACAAAPAFRDCGTAALLSGDVATAVRCFTVAGGRLQGPGPAATADAVSAAWAERFARALAPLRPAAGGAERARPAAAELPQSARLLDELGLARATPASLMARWAAATDQGQAVGGHAEVVLGSGRRGPVGAELVAEGPHLLIEGPPGSGRTELLRSVAASLSSAARPDRLGLVLLDGAGGERGEGLGPCTDLPHVSAHLVASDPLRMREFAQALGAELKRRAELLAADGGLTFGEWHARREVGERLVPPRQPSAGELRGDLDPPRSGTLRLRAGTRTEQAAGPSPLPRLVVLVDDFDALVAPGLGSAGRPAAGSVVRALEAVAREGGRLGVHLVAASARPERTAATELARLTTLRAELGAPDEPGPGRGVLRYADGRSVPFQAGRVTGRIPRTATQRPTVVPLEWDRMGDPPARRPVRELGNGPTDLALLASALERASHLVSAVPVLFPPAP
ncbi:FtsK/SpoIIIE domain-containing protein [Streptomyces sp. NPDC012888]|uniref:FtsK/SpoIIIE domain-containing protein n=1 Tax=Streptomyces sp. NPDC012888 TaxID=3364855 RepID=UPI0036ABFD56